MKTLIIITLSLAVSGCASLQLASLSVSGISYAVSGKSLTDHALSVVQRCAFNT